MSGVYSYMYMYMCVVSLIFALFISFVISFEHSVEGWFIVLIIPKLLFKMCINLHVYVYIKFFRSIKTGQSGFVSGPSSAGKQSAPSSSSGRSFSPAGSRPKTSPTALNTSPHRNEHSPAAKSPLLGTAPPGLLPPPDKGAKQSTSTFCMAQICVRYIYMYGKFLFGRWTK